MFCKFLFRFMVKGAQLIFTIQCYTMGDDGHTSLFLNSAPNPVRHLHKNMISMTCEMRDSIGKGIIKLLEGIFRMNRYELFFAMV